MRFPEKLLSVVFFCFLAAFFFSACCRQENKIKISPYPASFDFAFTITDDPDNGWIEEKKAVYDYLDSLGMKTSMGVWVFNNRKGSANLAYYYQGVSLEDPEYLKYVKGMKAKGFEHFLHTVTGGNDTRIETIAGFEKYRELFGEYPHHWINHFSNYENIYWGYKRFNNPIMKFAYKKYEKVEFKGDDPESEYFWGDICKKHIKYVRGWATPDLNTLKFNPSMPYHDPEKPYVRYWYACSDGANKDKFNRLLSKKNVDRLIRENGTAIVYTHFASGFVDRNGELDAQSKSLLADVARHRNGWFVPVNVILDRFELLRSVNVCEEADSYLIINDGNTVVKDLSVEVYDENGVKLGGRIYKADGGAPSKITIECIQPGTFVRLEKVHSTLDLYLSRFERFRLASSWLISRFY